jgi:hypothetical protein
MPEKTDTTKAGAGDTVTMLTTVDETGAVVHVVPAVSHPQSLHIEVQAKISRTISPEETQPAAMKGKAGRKAMPEEGAPAGSKKGRERKNNNPIAPRVESNPYSLEGEEEGLVEANVMNTTVGTAIEVHSPKTKKKTAVSPTKVNAGEGVGEGGGSDVTCGSGLQILIAENRKIIPKLVIFNIHGTLLDCSMRKEKNPNPNIRYTVQTESRKVVFRPGLREFLSKCFINFTVAFWGSKNESYTDDVLPALLGGVERSVKYCPLCVVGEEL